MRIPSGERSILPLISIFRFSLLRFVKEQVSRRYLLFYSVVGKYRNDVPPIFIVFLGICQGC